MPPFRFYLITDRANSRHDPLSLVPLLAQAGLKALQIREKQLTPRDLADFCLQLHQALGGITPPPALYLNDRADLAMSLGLSGVHLREDSLPLTAHAPALKEGLRFGVSTHSLEGVLAAHAAGADFATFGPVFPTASKARYGKPVGLKALEDAAQSCPLPLLALGGVTPPRVAACLAAGAHGVAAISAIWNAEAPLAELDAFDKALGGL